MKKINNSFMSNYLKKLLLITIMIEIFIIIFLLLQLIGSKHFNISGKLTKGMLFATDYSYFDNLNEKEIPLNCPDFLYDITTLYFSISSNPITLL
jgi:hypothetical protein